LTINKVSWYIPIGCEFLGTLLTCPKKSSRFLSAVALDEYYVKKIVAYEEKGKNPRTGSSRSMGGV